MVTSPELSLPEIELYARGLAELSAVPALEALVLGREQLLLSRDRLGEAEGVAIPDRSSPAESFFLEDGKGYRFPVEVTQAGTHLYNSLPTDLCAHLDELAAVGVRVAIVQQSELSRERRDVFAREGLVGLARCGRSPGSTTGHLFRGVT